MSCNLNFPRTFPFWFFYYLSVGIWLPWQPQKLSSSPRWSNAFIYFYPAFLFFNDFQKENWFRKVLVHPSSRWCRLSSSLSDMNRHTRRENDEQSRCGMLNGGDSQPEQWDRGKSRHAVFPISEFPKTHTTGRNRTLHCTKEILHFFILVSTDFGNVMIELAINLTRGNSNYSRLPQRTGREPREPRRTVQRRGWTTTESGGTPPIPIEPRFEPRADYWEDVRSERTKNERFQSGATVHCSIPTKR